MQRKTVLLLLSCALMLVWSAAVFGAAKPRYRGVDPSQARDLLRVAGDPAEDAREVSSGRTYGLPVSVGASPATSPGFQVGITTYDYQHNGSTGRQIDKFGNKIQMTWMRNDQFSSALGRSVYWNKLDVIGSPTPLVLDDGRTIDILPLGNVGSSGGQAAITGGNRPGYTTFRNLPSGRGVTIAHDAPEAPATGAFWFAAVDAAVAVGVFIQNNAPQPAGILPGDEAIWPHGCTDVVGADTVLHVVARGSSENTSDPAFYWRGIVANGGTAVTWSTPVVFDTLTTISCVVEQDPNSNKVAIVYTKPRSLTSQVNNDLVYRHSTDGGLSWSGIINITNYSDSSLDRAYTDVDALYDPNGTLHIVYNTLDYRPGDGTFFEPCDLVHWNDVRQTSRVINTIDLPEGGNSCSELAPFSGGAWNLAMSKQSIAVKPAGVNGIAEELLYTLWVQFGPTDTDCATQDSAGTLGGMVNGELWCSTSSNDGLTWDRPVNLTGTETPDCLPGDCHSEHWVSAARLADSGVYMSYVDDTHAGGVIQDSPQEGAWSTSPYRVLAVKARTPVLEPRISVGPTTFTELNVAPGGSDTRTITVNNVGNSSLTYNVVVTADNGGASHVLVNGGGSFGNTIAAAGAPDVLTITYDGIGLPNPSEHDWRLEVTSNDAANDPGQGGTPIDINVNVFVASPWFVCTSDTISTGVHRLAVGSCLELGDQGDGGGLFTYADSTEWIFDASPVIARLDGPTKRAYRDIFWNSLADRSRDSNRAFRAQSAITVNRNTTVNGKAADQASGVATTTDSLIQIDWTATAFREPDLTNGAVARYLITNRTGTTFNGLILGAAADLDVDSIAGDNDGIVDETTQYVGAQGGYMDTSGTIFTAQNNFAALFNIPLDVNCAGTAVGGQVLDNQDYVFPEGAYNTDTLYNWMNTMVGWNASTLQADTITDVDVVMVTSQGNTLTAAGSLEFAIGLAVSDVSQSDLRATIALLKNAVNDSCIAGCPITLTGDVNLSGTITSADIIGLVNFVFKGGSAPQPCTAAGDVNCSGTVTSADIIGLVNFVFKGGAAPCDACGSALASAC